jgi:hypothetical protein
MDRVVGHREVANADAHPVTKADIEGIDAREGPTVEGPQIEIEHGVDLRHHAARVDVVGVQQEAEVTVCLVDPRVLLAWMGHPEAHHPHRHLDHFVGVRMVHEGARAACHEFVHVRPANRNGLLIQAGDPVHAVRQTLAVPVNRGRFGQPIGHEQAHAVAFDHLDGRPRALAVVTPESGDHTGRDLAFDRFRNQVELLHAIVHAPGCSPAVQRDHRVVGTSLVGHAWRCSLRRGHDGGLGQGGQCNLADPGDGHSTQCCATDEIPSIHDLSALLRQIFGPKRPHRHRLRGTRHRRARPADSRAPARNHALPASRHRRVPPDRARWTAGPRYF